MNHAPETRNPFTNGKIIATSVLPSVYHRSDHKRGELAYVMSRGELMSFDECPAKWIAGGRSADTAATEWGTLVDTMLLDPERFKEVFAVAPKTYPAPKTCKAVKKGRVKEGDPIPWDNRAGYCQEWREAAEDAGYKPVSWQDYQDAAQAVNTLLCNEEALRVVRESDKQVHVTAEYHDKATGIVVPFKILVDILPPKHHEIYGKSVFDFKTCRDASLRKWTRDVAEYKLHVQGAAYMDVVNAVEGEDRCDFRHMLSESEHPWQPGFRILSNEFMELGRAEYVAALERYCSCLRLDDWPGYEEQARTRFNGFAMTEPEPYMLKAVA